MAPTSSGSDPRAAAVAVAARLRGAGHVAYFAGGCVRDRLRGERPEDYDIATDALPERVLAVFPRARGVGVAFGVMLVRHAGHVVEVATFRQDGAYGDGRRPDSVRFGSPREDAERRDFTINGLFEDPVSGAVIDYVGGERDLRAGIVRAIGDADARLAEDRLRTLRGVRFAARFGYEIEPATHAAIARSAGLGAVSRERVGHELRRMFGDRGRGRAAGLLEELRLDAEVLAEPSQRSGTGLVAALPEGASFECALTAWLFDRSAAAADPGQRRRRLAAWGRALVLSNAESEQAVAILGAAEVLGVGVGPGTGADAGWLRLGTAARKRAAAGPGFGPALLLLAGAAPALAGPVREEVSALATHAGGLAPAPLVTGDDLVAELALSPGPAFKEVLRAVYDAQLEGRISTRAEALALARECAR